MGFLNKMFGSIDISNIRITRNKPKRKTVLSELMEYPERFILEGTIENEEIVIRIKRKESE